MGAPDKTEATLIKRIGMEKTEVQMELVKWIEVIVDMIQVKTEVVKRIQLMMEVQLGKMANGIVEKIEVNLEMLERIGVYVERIEVKMKVVK